MKKPKYLYHGSSIKCTVLHPNQAYDWGFDAGNKFAVYATSSKHIASLFALGCSSKHSDEPCHRILDYKYGTPLQMLYWSLYAAIFSINTSSIAIHKKCGFREIGYREKVSKDRFGTWKDTTLLERRSTQII